ncbi:MAG: histidinol dehydrogenase [Lachnospiraceae bacterium]|nr:histidinol dehydrogenase [Lachnospiraceae bacterium]
MKTIKLTTETKKDVLTTLLKRGVGQFPDHERVVNEIINSIKVNGDSALFNYTKIFDKCDINAENIRVTKEEIAAAYERVDPEFVAVMKRAAANIISFHEKQKRESWFETKPDGSILGQRITPLDISGVYIPGGKAAYPASVLMNVIPAKVAGVLRIVAVTPPDAKGNVYDGTLVACDIAGVNEIYKAGGAQAIAALAFGTESIPKVDKVTGPGNMYVTLAKKACFGFVSIDSLAGPSEILVLADEAANPRYIAADLLSQAEHDELASAILVTTSSELAEKVSQEVDKFLDELPRSDIMKASLENYGYILLAKDMEEAIELTNDIAAEHVEILTKAPFEIMPKIRHAGALFLGEYSSEPLGDYFAGPNHIIPTNGTARFFSPLSVEDFTKKSSIIAYSAAGLKEVHKDIELFAEKEGLTAHANAIRVRFER